MCFRDSVSRVGGRAAIFDITTRPPPPSVIVALFPRLLFALPCVPLFPVEADSLQDYIGVFPLFPHFLELHTETGNTFFYTVFPLLLPFQRYRSCLRALLVTFRSSFFSFEDPYSPHRRSVQGFFFPFSQADRIGAQGFLLPPSSDSHDGDWRCREVGNHFFPELLVEVPHDQGPRMTCFCFAPNLYGQVWFLLPFSEQRRLDRFLIAFFLSRRIRVPQRGTFFRLNPSLTPPFLTRPPPSVSGQLFGSPCRKTAAQALWLSFPLPPFLQIFSPEPKSRVFF